MGAQARSQHFNNTIRGVGIAAAKESLYRGSIGISGARYLEDRCV